MGYIALPREGNGGLTKFFVERGAKGEILKSLNRCRLKLKLMFLSDMVMANRRQLDVRLLREIGDEIKASKYNFPKEEPTREDWQVWERLWVQNTEPGMILQKTLGNWINPTHRR